AGLNVIELHCRDYRPSVRSSSDDPPARYGTEIESIYLIGDFSVTPLAAAATPECPRWSDFELPPVSQSLASGTDPFTLMVPQPLRAGDITRQGCPFFAGRLRYYATLPASSQSRRLRVERLDAAVAEVALNGLPIGH